MSCLSPVNQLLSMWIFSLIIEKFIFLFNMSVRTLNKFYSLLIVIPTTLSLNLGLLVEDLKTSSNFKNFFILLKLHPLLPPYQWRGLQNLIFVMDTKVTFASKDLIRLNLFFFNVSFLKLFGSCTKIILQFIFNFFKFWLL